MTEPLTGWYCDICGDPITDANDGLVIWQTMDRHQKHNYKIVHQGCDRTDHNGSVPISFCLGLDGLDYLLNQISVQPSDDSKEAQPYCAVSEIPNFVELIRRLHIPSYEKKR